MKKFSAAMLFASLATFNNSATSTEVGVGPLPAIGNSSPKLKQALDSLRSRIKADAEDCAETAKAMESTGTYRSSINKILDTGKVIAFEVSGIKKCDGVHSSTYQYGIAFEKTSGRLIDLNQIYNLGFRHNGRLFVRPELIPSVKASYKVANEHIPSCLAETGWEADLANLPITFLPLPDGSVALYYAAPEVIAACYRALHLDSKTLSKLRDTKQASEYGLP